jgi:hypothetical protein
LRNWTARVTDAATTTTARTMGKVGLIRMECGQGRNDNTVGRACQKLRVECGLDWVFASVIDFPARGQCLPNPRGMGVKCGRMEEPP